MITIKVTQDIINDYDDNYDNQLYNVDATFNIAEDTDGISVMKAIAAAMRLETFTDLTIASSMKNYGEFLEEEYCPLTLKEEEGE